MGIFFYVEFGGSFTGVYIYQIRVQLGILYMWDLLYVSYTLVKFFFFLSQGLRYTSMNYIPK